MKSSKVLVVVVLIVIVVGIFYFVQTGAFSDTPCDWCGHNPTKAYKMHDGSYSYVCKDCSSRCVSCGDKATKQGENYFGMAVFMCDDCYSQQ